MTETNHNNHSKQQPPRRGRGGGGGRNRGVRKNHVSEGDALDEMPTPAGSHPVTPMRPYAGNPSVASQPANSRSTNKKGVRKPKPHNVDVSVTPSNAEPGHGTPPLTDPVNARLIPSAPAYASSSSFHSPAPNTLPRPAFAHFTKSETFAHVGEGAAIRARSESVNVLQPNGQSPSASDSEAPSPLQNIGIRTHQESYEYMLQQEGRAERDLRRANSANAAAPFSAPSRSHGQFHDAAIPFALPHRPAQRGVSDHNGSSSSHNQPNAFGRPIHQSLPSANLSHPHVQHLSAQSSQDQLVQPNMQQFSPHHIQAQLHRQHVSPHTAQAHVIQPRPRQYAHNEQTSAAPTQGRYFSPQSAHDQEAYPPAHFSSPQHTPAHVTQREQLATPPQQDKSAQLKSLLWGSSTPPPQISASAPGRPNHSSAPSSGVELPNGPHLRGGSSDPSAVGIQNFGGQDPRKSLAEDALRKVLGLNFPLSMSSGLDGNHSPQSRFSGHA